MKTFITLFESWELQNKIRLLVYLTVVLMALLTSFAFKPASRNKGVLQKSWVILYDEEGCTHELQLIKGGEDIENLTVVNFNNKCSSIRYKLPIGWSIVLYDSTDFQAQKLVLEGTGNTEEIILLGNFNNKASSVRWEEDAE